MNFRSLRGRASVIYSGMVSRCANVPVYKKRMPRFQRHTFIDWCENNTNYRQLFAAWESSGFSPRLSPSIDRIDNNKGYVLSNIQFLPMREHQLKTATDKRARHGNPAKKRIRLFRDIEAKYASMNSFWGDLLRSGIDYGAESLNKLAAGETKNIPPALLIGINRLVYGGDWSKTGAALEEDFTPKAAP